MLVLTNVGWLLKIDLVINQGLGLDIEYTTYRFYLQVIPDLNLSDLVLKFSYLVILPCWQGIDIKKSIPY